MIPNFNGAKYIPDTLASLKLQGDRIRDAQIMVLDNCSTDDSEEIIKATWGQRVSFHRNDSNLGPTGNFNACIAHATGSWVHILHSDDLLLRDAYKDFDRCLQHMPDAAIVFANNIEIDESGQWIRHGRLIGPAEYGTLNYNPDMWRLNFIQFVGIIFRKEAALATGDFDDAMPFCSDWNYWWRIARRLPAAYMNTPVGLYRVFAGNDTSRNMRTGVTITDPLKQIEKLIQCPKSADILGRLGKDYFYRPMFESAVWQCSLFFGDSKCFSANIEALRKFPRSLFTAQIERKLHVQHLRHRLGIINVKQRLLNKLNIYNRSRTI